MMKVLLLLCITSIWASPLDIDGRIFGGSTAADAQFPYQAFIKVTKEKGDDLNCAGAILSKEWIITSAFCIFGARVASIQVGSNTVFTSDPHRMSASADRFIVPDGYDGSDPNAQYRGNIGLIKLKTPLVYNEYIAHIPIAQEDLGDEILVTATGWGSIRAGSSALTNYLQYVPLRIISNSECSLSYATGIVNDDVVCGRSTTSRVKSICLGDEGAPLVRDASTKPLLVGIGAFSSQKGCGNDAPSGFSRIYNYLNWIKQVTGGLSV